MALLMRSKGAFIGNGEIDMHFVGWHVINWVFICGENFGWTYLCVVCQLMENVDKE